MLTVTEQNAPLHFTILLNGESSAKANSTHIPLYTRKGLLTPYESAKELSEGIRVPEAKLGETFGKYNAVCQLIFQCLTFEVAKAGTDEYGKTKFNSIPYTPTSGECLQPCSTYYFLGPFHAGIVTPALHYCMGGISITARGQVKRQSGEIIPGLWAAGEVDN